MDQNRLALLMNEIDRQGGINDFSAPSPAVPIDLFFQGNDDPGSIGCNIPDDEYPGIGKFYEVLKSIQIRNDVQAVLVRIYEVEDGMWPFSDEVYILTSASLEEVKSWVADLFPAEVYGDSERNDGKDWESVKPLSGPDLLPGMNAFYVWWD